MVATAVSHPFDTIRTRMHTMRALPNGRMPYANSLDCFLKLYRYESQIRYNSNMGVIYAGCYASFVRTFGIAYVSMRLLDYYFDSTPMQELWQPARYNYHGGIDFDIHEPFTLAFHKGFAYSHNKPSFTDGSARPEGEGGITTV